jgi:hypothetical protein
MTRVLIILILVCASASASTQYTETMFRRAMALNNGSVSESGRPLPPPKGPNEVRIRISSLHLYVLITVRDQKNGIDRKVCTPENNLYAAIAAEHRLDVINDRGKIFDLAMAAPNRVFEFKNRTARELVRPIYTQQQLEEVRQRLRGKAQRELRKEAELDLLKTRISKAS